MSSKRGPAPAQDFRHDETGRNEVRIGTPGDMIASVIRPDLPYGVFGLPLLRKIAAVLSWSAIRSSLSRADAEQRRRQTGRGR